VTVDKTPSSLSFTETMRGWAALEQTDARRGARIGRRRGLALEVELTIEIPDVSAFLEDRAHRARVRGWVAWTPLGAARPVRDGAFNLFPADDHGPGRELRYRLHLQDDNGSPLTLLGFKAVRDDPGLDLWKDTTTLFVWLVRGHVEVTDEVEQSQVRGAGIIRIHALGFLRQLLSFRTGGGGRWAGLRARARFTGFFAGELARRGYANPFRPASPQEGPVRPLTPVLPATERPLSHRPDLRRRIVPFDTEDGRRLSLVNVQGDREPDRGPVVLAAGAALRGDAFEPPVPTTLIDALVDHGYDVWVENWRGSTDVVPSQWTVDQVAVFDHPKAVAEVVRRTGADEVKAVVHCAGSITFTTSAVAGLLPEVTTIVSSAVSLHPVIPTGSRIKMRFARPVIDLVIDYMNPRWSELDEDPGWAARALVLLARTFHRECRNTVCRMVSFTYGYGFPALWRHENLNDDTHDWVREVFGRCPMSFFNHMASCVASGRIIATERFRDRLALDLADPAWRPHTNARFAFFAGERNRCFLPESQLRTYNFLNQPKFGYPAGYHSLHVQEGYGHMDLLVGQRAAVDVFPRILAELDRPALPPRRPDGRVLSGQQPGQLGA
jgi:hypothetical protein